MDCHASFVIDDVSDDPLVVRLVAPDVAEPADDGELDAVLPLQPEITHSTHKPPTSDWIFTLRTFLCLTPISSGRPPPLCYARRFLPDQHLPREYA